MRAKIFIMTQTTQPRSWAKLSEVGKDINLKPETENNMDLLLSVFDSLNNLCESLSKLNNAIERKIIEQGLNDKGKGLSK